MKESNKNRFIISYLGSVCFFPASLPPYSLGGSSYFGVDQLVHWDLRGSYAVIALYLPAPGYNPTVLLVPKISYIMVLGITCYSLVIMARYNSMVSDIEVLHSDVGIEIRSLRGR